MFREKNSERGLGTMKRLTSLLMILTLCFGLMIPANNVSAASTLKITYKGTVRTYSGRKNSVYVNNKKKGFSKVPIFKKSGTYVGPVDQIFKNTSLKVSVSYDSKTLTMKYQNNTIQMKNGSRKVIVNGVTDKDKMGAAAMYVTYTSSGKKRWVVPLKSVCSRLGISYKLIGGVIKLGGVTNSVPTTSVQPAPTPVNPGPVTMVIDAGHGGSDSGATGNGLKEKNLTLAIVLGAKKYFDKDPRFKVYYTRTADTYPSLDDRCKLANNNNADLFLCVHINSASSSARGAETLYNPNRNMATTKNGITSKDFATAMQQAVIATTGFTNRGLKSRTDLRVLNQTNMPACLIEYGFISNSTEARIMNANTERYGKELYEAVVNYLKTKGRIS